jgi:hypothetical protein
MHPSDTTYDRYVDRVHALCDDDESPDSIVLAGENDDAVFALVILRRRYEGDEFLNERYVMLHKRETTKDTFMQNGVNRRVGDMETLADGLAKAYMAVRNRADMGRLDHGDTIVKDARGDD